MRSLSSTLTTAQKGRTLEPLYRIALNTGGGGTTTYNEDRIISVSHLEEPFHGAATVVLDNSDLAVTTDFKGYQAILSYGLWHDTDERVATAPMHVIDQQYHSSPGVLTVTLTLQGLADELGDDKASAQYVQTASDLNTLKDLLTQVVKGVLPDWAVSTASALDDLVIPATQNDLVYKCTTAGTSGGSEPTFTTTIGGTTSDNTVTWTCIGKEITVYSHTRAYTPTFDSEDSLLDSFNPADSFSIAFNGTRLGVIEKLLRYTKTVMRSEDDGEIHFRQPTVSGSSYDNEYKLDVHGEHDIFIKANRKVLLNPNRIEVSSHPDDGDGFSGTAEDTGSSDVADMEKREHYYVRAESDSECNSLAAAILEKYQSGQQKGAALVPMHMGQEVHDYINFTDARNDDTRAGNVGAIQRFAGEGRWEMRIALGDIRSGGFLGMSQTRRVTARTSNLDRYWAAYWTAKGEQAAQEGPVAQLAEQVSALADVVNSLGQFLEELVSQVNNAFQLQHDQLLEVLDVAQRSVDASQLVEDINDPAYLLATIASLHVTERLRIPVGTDKFNTE